MSEARPDPLPTPYSCLACERTIGIQLRYFTNDVEPSNSDATGTGTLSDADANETQMSGPKEPRSRLHWVYFILAGFDLVTVALSLFIIVRVGDIYTDSIRVNQEWASRLGDYRELTTLAAEVNAPGNDVFTSRDVGAESARLEQAATAFVTKLKAARDDLTMRVEPNRRVTLLSHLDIVDRSHQEMLAEARAVLKLFREGDLQAAGQRMTTMDRSYARLVTVLADAGGRVSDIQSEEFDRQSAEAGTLRRFEFVIVALIIAMVVAITFYGRKLARRMIESETQVRRLNAELEDRVRDRTAELSAANESLFEREQRLQAILDTAFCAIVTFDAQGTIESCNRAVQRVFGHDPKELCGKSVDFLLAPSDGREVPASFIEHIGTCHPEGHAQERLGFRSDGTTFPVAMYVTTLGLSERQLFTAVISDLTDEMRALQAERLASIGQMITAITHESRNALQRIQAGVDILQFSVTDDAEATEDLGRMAQATEDLQRLFEDLRSFAAPVTLNLSNRELSSVWRRAWASLESSRDGREATLHEELNGVDLTCALDSFRVEQVFRNLMENSLAACHDPVELFVECHETQLNGAPAVCVRVRDNGPGLSQEQRKRIFEAFFTTKTKGTGLGMAIAHRIVAAHHGQLALGDSNAGAEFVISFPRDHR